MGRNARCCADASPPRLPCRRSPGLPRRFGLGGCPERDVCGDDKIICLRHFRDGSFGRVCARIYLVPPKSEDRSSHRQPAQSRGTNHTTVRESKNKEDNCRSTSPSQQDHRNDPSSQDSHRSQVFAGAIIPASQASVPNQHVRCRFRVGDVHSQTFVDARHHELLTGTEIRSMTRRNLVVVAR